ncbi:MAG: precorrin-8X methylmutase [Firmicutes bacterium]|nr:precorrin-8X methylmutase [Bacillota bacterium]
MEYEINPGSIEQESMAIIEKNIPFLAGLPDGERNIIKRIVHTTGDFDIAPLVKIHPRAVAAGLAALGGGCTIFTDVNMVLAGLNKKKMAALGVGATCRIADQEVVEEARRTGETRARLVMLNAGPLEGDIVVIGNAPTALFALCELIEAGAARPTLVIGTPVGFVGARESKDLLASMNRVPYITLPGTRGGSAIAAAAANALLYMK